MVRHFTTSTISHFMKCWITLLVWLTRVRGIKSHEVCASFELICVHYLCPSLTMSCTKWNCTSICFVVAWKFSKHIVLWLSQKSCNSSCIIVNIRIQTLKPKYLLTCMSKFHVLCLSCRQCSYTLSFSHPTDSTTIHHEYISTGGSSLVNLPGPIRINITLDANRPVRSHWITLII